MNVIEYGFNTIAGTLICRVGYLVTIILHAIFRFRDSVCSMSCKMLRASIEMEYKAKGTANHKKVIRMAFMCLLSGDLKMLSSFVTQYKNTVVINKEARSFISNFIDFGDLD